MAPPPALRQVWISALQGVGWLGDRQEAWFGGCDGGHMTALTVPHFITPFTHQVLWGPNEEEILRRFQGSGQKPSGCQTVFSKLGWLHPSLVRSHL